ncbi:MAG TPA: hypothetical protein VN154_10570, partial [Rhizomicrobium sp.]|nr:hypothetical protein [Rhizomicrobium sp.]
VDEPLQGLDAFAQSVIRDLLQSFRDEEGPAFLVITSDFAVAKSLAEDAMVFKDGQIVERGSVAELLRSPKHPYTRSLAEASRIEPLLPVTNEKREEKPATLVAEQPAAAPAHDAKPDEQTAPEAPLVEKTAASGTH